MKQKQIFDIFSKTKKEKIIPKHKIEIDYRERNCLVPSLLKKLNFEIEIKELKVADYIVKDVAIERKTIDDFISSMINRRLSNQLQELQQYENKLLIIEGFEHQDLYSQNVNANALRGFILSILLKYKVPIIFTKNQEDTAKFIYILANKQTKEMSLNAKKKTLNKKEQLQFIIESFPGIGPKTAKKLLEKFNSIKNIINSSKEELKEILGIKAETIKKIIDQEY